MAPELPITLAGESVHLLGARALYWPARDALLIADLHLGKADLFRRSGIGLPSGGTSDDLQRLGAVRSAMQHIAEYPQMADGASSIHSCGSAHWKAIMTVCCPRPTWASNCWASVSRKDRSCCVMHRSRSQGCMCCVVTCIRWPACRACSGVGQRSGCAKE